MEMRGGYTPGLNFHPSLKKYIILCFVFLCTFLLMSVIYYFVITDYMNTVRVHRCGASGSMRACHAEGPGSIPGRDKFPGWGFSGVFPHL